MGSVESGPMENGGIIRKGDGTKMDEEKLWVR